MGGRLVPRPRERSERGLGSRAQRSEHVFRCSIRGGQIFPATNGSSVNSVPTRIEQTNHSPERRAKRTAGPDCLGEFNSGKADCEM